MYEQTYDIIDWKSCASCSERRSSVINNHNNNKNKKTNELLPRKASDGSNASDIVFPSLFFEGNETETSIVTLGDNGSEGWPSETIRDVVPDDMEQLSVYQKVANWVSTQKVFFRKEEEAVIEDDDLEVIDPVDLFHESILDEYLLVTEDDSERRVILRDLNDHRYDIESVQELMQTHEYKFIRQPKGDLQLEMDRIIEFGKPISEDKDTRRRSKKRSLSTCTFPDAEEAEDKIHFLGVPRILENYVILNREGYVVNLDATPDLWLSPFEENLDHCNELGENNQSELDFLSSWFSEVYQTDYSSSDRRRPTFLTDMMEKLTVISVGSDDEEVWVDAPEIPHWLDEEPEELELFNQPSRPLYYYRDRIKGCYRIIGVEDETVVLFSGNDDDTIFYSEDNTFNKICTINDSNKSDPVAATNHLGSVNPNSSFVSKYRRIYNRLRYGRKEQYDVSDTKNDSGIDEDIDETVCEDIEPFSLPSEETEGYTSVVTSPHQESSFAINPNKESFVECLFVVMGACIVVITLVLYENGSPLFQMYRSKITEEVYNDIHAVLNNLFK